MYSLERTNTTNTTSSSNVSEKKYPIVPSDFSVGLLGKLVDYTAFDDKVNFTFELENGATLNKKVFNPSSEKQGTFFANTLIELAEKVGINKKLSGTVDTFKEFCDAYFLGEKPENYVRLKVGFAKNVHTYDPSKFVGKSLEEIKAKTHPFINITQNIMFFADKTSNFEFRFDDKQDKVFTDYELMESVVLPDLDPVIPESTVSPDLETLLF